uniref:Cyclic nucleotide-binding domain-containing protein n=1 Tax=Mesocestoides corti TaxID=53468 RepID=A0A5K3FDH1_MESCO
WRRIRAQTCWTTWPQLIPCLPAIQWHAGKEGIQPEKDMDEMQYIISGVASVVDSDGRRLTCVSGLFLVNEACSVVPVLFLSEVAAAWINVTRCFVYKLSMSTSCEKAK